MSPRPSYLATDALLSADTIYRYWLSRRLAPGGRTIAFIGLNPSTADGTVDDPTVRREVGFARAWGFDWYLKGNIYAYRATNPKDLPRALVDIHGPDNLVHLQWIVEKAEIVVAAWGAVTLDCLGNTTAGWIRSLAHSRCLGRNQDGSPRHPLYLSKDTPLTVF